MARLNIPPTKSSLLAVRRDLAVAAEGFSLLDQKREILVLDLMRLLAEVRPVQERLEAVCREAYAALRSALAANGSRALALAAAQVRLQPQVTVVTRVVAGARVPDWAMTSAALTPQYGFAGADATADAAMDAFRRLLATAGEMARLETAVRLLARELKKTRRRVNALEQLFLPSYRETVAYIQDSLAGRELDAIFVMKLVKRRLEGAAAGGQSYCPGVELKAE